MVKLARYFGIGLAVIAVAFLALFLLYALFVFMPVSVLTEQQCLSLGWKDSKVAWNLERYCIREENEYEITKPLHVVRREQR